MIRVDARGLRCPWPALRLSRALRLAEDDLVELLADDPAAERECGSVADAAGWRLDFVRSGCFKLVRINLSFTAPR